MLKIDGFTSFKSCLNNFKIYSWYHVNYYYDCRSGLTDSKFNLDDVEGYSDCWYYRFSDILRITDSMF